MHGLKKGSHWKLTQWLKLLGNNEYVEHMLTSVRLERYIGPVGMVMT